MPDVLKKICTLFAPDGTIEREYKTVLFEGEGAPRDVEITAEDRTALYGAAHAVSTALVTDLQDQVHTLTQERDAARARVAELTPEPGAP